MHSSGAATKGVATVAKIAVLGAVVVAVALMAAGSTGVGAQTPSTENPLVLCAKILPKTVFLGTVDRISGNVVTYNVTRIVSGAGTTGTAVDVGYPTEYNARKLKVDHSYKVAATLSNDQLESTVQTAQLTACGQYTRNPDGSRIDTGAMSQVGSTVRRYAPIAGGLVLGCAIGLLLLNRLFDRRSRYDKARITKRYRQTRAKKPPKPTAAKPRSL